MITYLKYFIYLHILSFYFIFSNERISNGKMVKGWLKVSILFKTDILLKCFAPDNAQLVISNHSYVEVYFWVDITKCSCTSSFNTFLTQRNVSIELI